MLREGGGQDSLGCRMIGTAEDVSSGGRRDGPCYGRMGGAGGGGHMNSSGVEAVIDDGRMRPGVIRVREKEYASRVRWTAMGIDCLGPE